MRTLRRESLEDESLIYLGLGGLTALLLGIVLVPLRDYTSASNFAFPFMALTIAMAEFGGRRSALVTALISVLSWDFFLTRPYLTLQIASKHEIISFFGLAICGLIAASFGSRSRRKAVDLGATRAHLKLLHYTLRQLEADDSTEQIAARILGELRASLPIAALVLRDAQGRLIVASGKEAGQVLGVPPLPDERLPADGERSLPSGGQAFPAQGTRLELFSDHVRVGWLELWGTDEKADTAAQQTLWDIARLFGMLLARGRNASSAPSQALRSPNPLGERG